MKGLDTVVVQLPGPPTADITYTLSPMAGNDRHLPLHQWSLDTVIGYYALDRNVRILQHWWIDACLKGGRKLGAKKKWGGWKLK